MDTIHVKFSVSVGENRYSRYDEEGQADLEFDLPPELFEQKLDYAPFMNGLVMAALSDFKKKQAAKTSIEEEK